MEILDIAQNEQARLDYPLPKHNQEESLEEKPQISLNNGYISQEIASKRAHQRFDLGDQKQKQSRETQNRVSKRPQRGSKSRVAYRGRSFKLVSPQEFKEVVSGFMKFLEEINNTSKQNSKRSKKGKLNERAAKPGAGLEEHGADKMSKRIKYNPDFKKYQDLQEIEFKDEISTAHGSVNAMISESQERFNLQMRQASNGPRGKITNLDAQIGQLIHGRQRSVASEKAGKPKLAETVRSADTGNLSATIMAETMRMKQMIENIMMNNPKLPMNFGSNNFNLFSDELLKNVMRGIGGGNSNKMAIENSAMIKKQEPVTKNDPRKTLRRSTLHVSLAYLIQTRKAEISKLEANNPKILIEQQASKAQAKSPFKGQQKPNVPSQQRSNDCIEIESDEETREKESSPQPAQTISNIQINQPADLNTSLVNNTSATTQESCSNHQKNGIEDSSIIILD